MYRTEVRLAVPAGEVLAYLARRPVHFEVNGDRATYRNEDTGAEIAVDIPGAAGDTAAVSAPMLRPSFWGIELGRVVDRLASLGAGTAGGAGDRAASEWEAQNRAAWRLEEVPHTSVVDDEVVDTWWSWNVHLIDVEPLYPELHLPKAQIGRIGGDWRTFAVWTDLGDAVLPPVDYVMVLSARLASRGVAPGLVPVTREQVERQAGPLRPDGVRMVGASSDKRWVELLRSVPALAGRLEAAHPEQLVERRYAGR